MYSDKYSDKDLLAAADVAYVDLHELDANGEPRFATQEFSELGRKGNAKIYNDPSQANWRVVAVSQDDNSGMYACVIDTGDGDCIISFRGTQEPQDILEDARHLNSTVTPQQKAAEKFVQDFYAKYGDRYQHITFTGHSLGGNLAQHALITAPDSLKKKADAVSLDGPGFSEAYIREHCEDIQKLDGKLKKIQWSLVGALLYDLPVESVIHVESREDSGWAWWAKGALPLTNQVANDFSRHPLDAVLAEVEANGGSFKHADPDYTARIAAGASMIMDFYAKMITDLDKAFREMGETIAGWFGVDRKPEPEPPEPVVETIYRMENACIGKAVFEADPARMGLQAGALEGYSGRIAGIRSRTNEIFSELPKVQSAFHYLGKKIVLDDLYKIERKMSAFGRALADVKDQYESAESRTVSFKPS